MILHSNSSFVTTRGEQEMKCSHPCQQLVGEVKRGRMRPIPPRMRVLILPCAGDDGERSRRGANSRGGTSDKARSQAGSSCGSCWEHENLVRPWGNLFFSFRIALNQSIKLSKSPAIFSRRRFNGFSFISGGPA